MNLVQFALRLFQQDLLLQSGVQLAAFENKNQI